MAQNPSSENFFAAVFTPSYKKHLAYRGKVKSLSSVNSQGNFDILPLHENFISIITGPLIIVDEMGKKQQINTDKALIEASNNIVKVFVDY